MSLRNEFVFPMWECLTLAERGRGAVSPNPLVGSLLLKNGHVVGRGYHRRYGEAHAEVNAIRSAGTKARGSTLVVNLEPCVHFGKTPPCVDLIVSSGIRHVVVGMRDPNPLVAGKGIRKLRAAGIKVTEGVLRTECESANEHFVKFITTGRPFVAVKIAQTINGMISTGTPDRRWITGPKSRSYVHRLRSEMDAVLVGAGTVIADNPRLTVRLVKGRNPVRVVVDGRLRAPLTASVFRTARVTRTIVLTSKKSSEAKARALSASGVAVVRCATMASGQIPVDSMLKTLGSLGIASVLVEGGSTVFGEFVESGLCDKLYCFVAPVLGTSGMQTLRKGAQPGLYALGETVHRLMGSDLLIEGRLTGKGASLHVHGYH